MDTYKVAVGQNIFDVALALYGSIEGLFDLMVNNPELSFSTVLKAGTELDWDEDFIVYEDIVNTLEDSNIVPANGERNVYPRIIEEQLTCYIKMNTGASSVNLSMAGDGNVLVDWGDNSDEESLALDSSNRSFVHYFNDNSDSHVVKLYGDFKLKTWDLSDIDGDVLPMRPIVVDEVLLHKNKMTLQGLYLCKGTYKVEITDTTVTSLNPIQDMSLSDLLLTGVTFSEDDVLNDYLIYIANNNNERRNCRVVLDTQPSGVYQEPIKDSNGNYQITSGMEAIYVITHESAWNESGAWKFIINGIEYAGEEN